MKRSFALLAVIALVAACGARSALDPPLAPSSASGDTGGGVIVHGAIPRPTDGSAAVDAGVVAPPDVGLPPDTQPSCLPAPPAVINGAYSGGWKGVIDCQPLIGNTPFNGELKLSLGITPNPVNFDVRGVMWGNVSGVSLEGDIEGSMGCTSVKAAIPGLSINGGTIPLQLDGSLTGKLSLTANGRLQLEGDFAISGQNFGNCRAKGTWFAVK